MFKSNINFNVKLENEGYIRESNFFSRMQLISLCTPRDDHNISQVKHIFTVKQNTIVRVTCVRFPRWDLLGDFHLVLLARRVLREGDEGSFGRVGVDVAATLAGAEQVLAARGLESSLVTVVQSLGETLEATEQLTPVLCGGVAAGDVVIRGSGGHGGWG